MLNINKTHVLGANEGSGQLAQHLYIIAHDTGNDNNKGMGSANAEASYMKGHYGDAYTHFIVDDQGIYQVGEPGYVAWGALNANPFSPVQIELAHVDSQARFNKSYANYIELIRHYAEKYNIPLTLDTGYAGTKGVKTHNWVTHNYGGDHVDPYGYLAKWGISKSEFAHDIANGVGENKIDKPKVASYFNWEPKYIYAKQPLKAYKDAKLVGSGKQVVKEIPKNTKLEVKKLVGHQFELVDGLFITANKAYVNNLYYTVGAKIKTVESVKGSNRYSDLHLKRKDTHYNKGTQFDIEKVIKDGDVTRLLLNNGMYLSANKLINKFVE